MPQSPNAGGGPGSDQLEHQFPPAPWPFLEATADASVVVDSAGIVVYANDRMQHLSGYTSRELLGHRVEMLVPVDARQAHRSSRRRYMADGPERRDMGTGIATRLRRRDGSELPVDIALTPLVADGRRLVLAAVRDMSDHQALVSALEDSERWLRSEGEVLEQVARDAPLEQTFHALAQAVAARSPGTACAIHVLDEPTSVLRLRGSAGLSAELAARVATVAPGDALCRDGGVPDVTSDPAWRGLAAFATRASLRSYACARVVKPGTDELIGTVGVYSPRAGSLSAIESATLESAARLVAIAHDHDRARSALSHAATHDPLTGLPNRFLLLDRLARILPHRRRSATTQVGIVFIDLDQFKIVNDSLGHSLGDRLLVAVGHRIAESVRPSDTLARFGGDEFVVLCERAADALQVVHIAQRLLDSLHRPFRFDGHVITVNASAGVSIDAREGKDAEAMIQEADAAMYRAKERGGGRVEVFDTRMWERAVRRLGLESDLRRAIDGGGLQLLYQPEVLLRGGAVVGVEALVRWQRTPRLVLGPEEFIPLAEQSGLIVPLGAWVLAQACADARHWRELGLGDLIVSVNVSTRQLVEPDFADMVRRILDAHGLDPRALCLEVTENAAFDAAGQPAEMLALVREMGVHVALDDFGTGYASLATLRAFSTDIVKIDRSFVAGLHGRVDRALTATVIAMARRLGSEVIAEGVETSEQEQMLLALGCSVGQGYRYAHPVGADAFTELVGRRGSVPILVTQP